MTAIQTVTPSALAVISDYAELVELTLRTLESAASARVYGQTFAAWGRWCASTGHAPMILAPGPVLAFLEASGGAKATRQRQLSALRKLAAMLYVLRPDEDVRRAVEALKLVRARGGDGAHARARRALSPADADRLLRAWGEPTVRHARNRALVAVLLLGGIRRAEAAALRWRDVDFANGVLHIAHGKGDKARDVPLAGDAALDALRAWQAVAAGREWVFTPVNKGGKVGADKPISGTDVYRIAVETGRAAGVEWRPHDARRTFITEALATGTPLATVQAIAGHAQGQTTLHYAQAVDARRARRELRLRYG